MNINGKNVLITGGASGIGFSLAKRFAQEGCHILVADYNEESCRKAKELIDLEYIVGDVSSETDRERIFCWATEERQVDYLISNAGIQRDIDFTKGLEDLKGPTELRINLEASVMLIARFVPYLMKRENTIIMTFTTGMIYMDPGKIRPGIPLYLASKAGIHSFTLNLRKQLNGTSVKVIEVVPPIVDTGINPEGRKKRQLSSWGIKPDVFADIVFQGLHREDSTIFSKEEDYPNPLILRNLI